MMRSRGQGYLFAGAFLLIAVVLLFSGFLNIASFRNNYIESLVGSYTVSGGEARRQIEYSLKYGKTLSNFANIEDILAEVPKDTPAIEAASIVLPSGRIVYDLQGPVKARRLPDALKVKADFREGKAQAPFNWVLSRGKYHAFLPIRDRNGAWVGTLDLQFDSAAVDRRTGVYLRESAGIMVTVAVGAIALLALLLALFKVIDEEGRIQNRRFSILLLVVLGVAQAVYGAVNVTLFRRAYLAIVQENTQLTGNIVQKTVDGIIRKGIAYTDLVGIEDWMGRVVQSIPEIERIDIETEPGATRYSTDSSAGKAEVKEAFRSRMPMKTDPTGTKATLQFVLSERYVSGKVSNLALDAATMLVTSFFFMVEMIVFLGLLLKLRMAREARRGDGPAVRTDDGDDLVRPLAFLLLISGYLSVSFIPVMMRDLYEPLLGLSPAVVLGLPISAEMFGAFLSSLFIGHAIDTRGWRPAFLGGLVAFGVGTVLSGTATTALMFILARAVVGLGYGATWMGLRGLVAAGATGASRTKGFSVLNAGIFAGQNCGAVLGAMLAERLGFPGVFFLAAALVVYTAGFALLLVPNVRPASTDTSGTVVEKAKTFFGDRSLLAFLLLITIPSAVCGMFLNYFLPIYSKSIGVSQGNIGRAFLAYGVCIVYVGPFLVRLLGNRLSGRRVMPLAGLLGVLALAVFCVKASFATAVTAVILLGISDSIGLVSQNSYFINLPAAMVFGRGKALSIFSAIKKVGQMLGPNAFGMASFLGAVPGVALVAGVYLAAIGAFVFVSTKVSGDRTVEEAEE